MNQTLSPEFILRLQRRIGNRAVIHFLRRRAVEARPTQLVPATTTTLVKTEAVPQAVSTALVEIRAENAVTVPAWRRMVNWIARRPDAG